MTVLSHDSIARLCRRRDPVVRGAEAKQIKTASYDLRLGDEYYLNSAADHGRGALPIQRLGDGRKTLEVPANQVVLVRTLEDLAMPTNLVGHLSLKLDVLMKGLIMSSQSQIDAGYRGPIYALLYNLSAEPATISLGESLLRLEFASLDKVTKAYTGDYEEDFTLGDIVKKRLTSSLASLEANVKDTQRRLTRNAIGGAIALLAAFLAIIAPFAQDASNAKAVVAKRQDEMRRLEAQLDAERAFRIDAGRRLAVVEEHLRQHEAQTGGTVRTR